MSNMWYFTSRPSAAASAPPPAEQAATSGSGPESPVSQLRQRNVMPKGAGSSASMPPLPAPSVAGNAARHGQQQQQASMPPAVSPAVSPPATTAPIMPTPASEPMSQQQLRLSHTSLAKQLDVAVSDKAELQRSLYEQLSTLEQLQITAKLMSSNVSKELERITYELDVVKHATSACIARFEGRAHAAAPPASTNPAASTAAPTSSSSSDASSQTLRPKQFLPRDSRLSVMLHVKDFSTVYNIFVAVLPILGISLTLQTYAESGQVMDMSLLTYAFGKLHVVAAAWTAMLGIATASYGWKYVNGRVPFGLLVTVYIACQAALALFAGYVTLAFRLPPASGLIVMCEQTRFSMKIHSFFRTHLPTDNVAPDVVYERLHGGRLDEGGFSEYMYFMFCPSLLYRTSYPRTPIVRWSRVLVTALETFFVVLYAYIIFSRFLFPVIRVPPSVNAQHNNLWEFTLMALNTMVPSMIIFVFGFFGFLHSWLNLWAEVLQFADREFYRDWWNSLSFAEYYRKWNGVVYDWLYTYVYSDAVLFLEKRRFSAMTSRALAALFVIEASAVIHEYILACALGFFFPVLMLMFGGPGVVFTHFTRKRKDQNVFVWAMLLVGCGLLITLYSREYYFRQLYLEPREQLDATYWKQFVTSYAWRHIFNIKHAA